MAGALRSDRGFGVGDVLPPATGNAKIHGEYLQIHPSLSFLFSSLSLKIVKRENCGIYTLKGERRSCICFRKNTDPSRVTSL